MFADVLGRSERWEYWVSQNGDNEKGTFVQEGKPKCKNAISSLGLCGGGSSEDVLAVESGGSNAVKCARTPVEVK